jgi:GNAT superfamily N-acetyltransferase
MQQREELFKTLLSNEQSFGRLFCQISESEYSTLFYNTAFAADPVFNHFAFKPSLLSDTGATEERLEQAISDARFLTKDLELRASFFVEDFWPMSKQFEKECVAHNYRVSGGMEILSKVIGSSAERRKNSSRTGKASDSLQIKTVERSEDLVKWTDVFCRSFGIPESWRSELKVITNTILAKHKEDSLFLLLLWDEKTPSGCVLLHKSPRDVMGVYCVGTTPEMRGRGVARALLVESERRAEEQGCKMMTLQTVTADNVTGMYVSMGYAVQFKRSLLEE